MLFLAGFGLLAVATVIRGWHAPTTARWGVRAAAAAGAVVLLVAVVDLPIPFAWLVLGHSWVAEEVGIVLAAVLALFLGQRWLRSGFAGGARPTGRRPAVRSG